MRRTSSSSRGKRGRNGFCGGHERDARRRHSRPFLSPPVGTARVARGGEGEEGREGGRVERYHPYTQPNAPHARSVPDLARARDGDETGYSI